ncbi:UDP-glucose dehydrogenase family protein [Latilactobacillus graminis]|uniref:UDP-glucose 6-dehydrogenase n=2 Tax=Latilactobacillus graminis TaxID=60519 RepID=A0AA89L3M7_9LACO|nr:UDP-glucose/GDP-mannose dehydrogenase family protein [Latilactobacillus graminis]KRM21195.1 udp-glucose 6-dehydrogenase [Latilactobacillus graminis DSM 20719]QFP79321.1 UDP-glucose/GDP-mannose dehydrogenase family protein [Latilactobacillus graminis]
MKISVVGTGYVGLVTGVSLAEMGQNVTCIDIDTAKINKLKQGISPIYEPQIEEMMHKNLAAQRLTFSLDQDVNYNDFDLIYLAVGTPENPDGSADLTYINTTVNRITQDLQHATIVVTKSTVPVGTNAKIKALLNQNGAYTVEVVSNPEFLREGSAVHDVFHADRLILGSDSQAAMAVVEAVNAPYKTTVIKTTFASAELIKYASNAFLATKISFVNEIANICEATGANIQAVSQGMGLDTRIGNKFLKAGIGYGGSCFPKDTAALLQIAQQNRIDFPILEATIKTNQQQQLHLVERLMQYYPDLTGKKIAILGAAFKPGTDDIREAPALRIIQTLLEKGARVAVYDPIALDNVREIFGEAIEYCLKIETALEACEAALIATEWSSIQKLNAVTIKNKMRRPLILDGRAALLSLAELNDIEYAVVGQKG